MCEPSTAIMIASTVAGFVGQQQVASAQEEANAQGRNLALQNRDLQIRALQNQEDEENRRATESLNSNSRAAEAARATAQVSAGESGVSGLSVDALLGDLVRQETENAVDIRKTQDFGQRQRDLDVEGLGITANSQINQLPLVQFPSFFEAGAEIAMHGYQGYQDYKARNPEE